MQACRYLPGALCRDASGRIEAEQPIAGNRSGAVNRVARDVRLAAGGNGNGELMDGTCGDRVQYGIPRGARC